MSFAGQVETTGGAVSPVASTLYGICDNDADVVVKSVPLEDFDELITGTTIHVKFTKGNTATSPKLAVGSTDAKYIYVHDTTPPGTTNATSWAPNSMVSLTYDGTYWRINDVGANDAIIAQLTASVANEASTREASMTRKMAPAFSAASTYSTGDVVIYNGALYRCNTAVTTPGAWDSTKWLEHTLAGVCRSRFGGITMYAANWTGNGPWTQTVTVTNPPTYVFSNSVVSLQPDATALGHMAAIGCAAIFITNNNGLLTATAIQKKPTVNLTVQCIVEEAI